MRVAISGFFWNKPHVGSGQYLHQLVRQLGQHPAITGVALLRPARPAPGPPLPPGVAALDLPTPFDRVGGRFANTGENLAKLYWEQVALPAACRSLGADLLHVPYWAPPLRCPIPVVVTIHDLVPLLLPAYRGGTLVRAYMRLVSHAARGSDAVIADSEATRRDVLAHLGLAPARVTTIVLAAAKHYRPPSDDERAATLTRLGLRRPFVYYVGGFDARKNVSALLRAFAHLHAQRPDVRLVLAGRVPPPQLPLFPDLRGEIAALGLHDAVDLPGFVSDDDNRALYGACAAFAFPSHYEGFGLPPLEAMACGAPVMVADRSSLPEVVGDAGLRVAPDDVAGWAAALQRLTSDEALRSRLAQAGVARAALFSEERMAEATVAVYQQVHSCD
jgi:glycosyltransferase involved in cell wall biosynthesis